MGVGRRRRDMPLDKEQTMTMRGGASDRIVSSPPSVYPSIANNSLQISRSRAPRS